MRMMKINGLRYSAVLFRRWFCLICLGGHKEVRPEHTQMYPTWQSEASAFRNNSALTLEKPIIYIHI